VKAGFLLDLLFDPEDGGDMFLRNVGRLSTEYTALYSRREKSSIKKFVYECASEQACTNSCILQQISVFIFRKTLLQIKETFFFEFRARSITTV
jgi:hypothetical protein